jgi:hypothetical protein
MSLLTAKSHKRGCIVDAVFGKGYIIESQLGFDPEPDRGRDP